MTLITHAYNGCKSALALVLMMVIFALASCTNKPEEPPIPVEKMQRILVDIHAAEQYSIGLGQDSVSTNDRSEKNLDSLAKFYQSIFKHYNINLQSFEEAMAWYMQHPNYLDTVYEKAQKTASLMQMKYRDTAAPRVPTIDTNSALLKPSLDVNAIPKPIIEP